MFPDMDLIEEELKKSEETVWNGKTYFYDFAKGDFVYKNGNLIELTGVDAIKMWVEKAIRTEKYSFKIYGDSVDYGISIEDLFGSDLERYLIESEIQREISEALLKNPYITGVEEWEFEYKNDKAIVSFSVLSDLENISIEVVI